jgi:BirA family biotin operon repressor/biotin-[acetyl-CoA-carboxylase] ligase
LELGLQGAPSGTVVVAGKQTGGRGRLRRTWFSPPHTGLYFSVLLRPNLAAAEISKITLAAGVSVCRAVEKACHLHPGLKWPNDIVFDGKKLGGILCESEPNPYYGAEPPPLIIVGVGLNVTTPASAFPADLQKKATSLLIASGREYSKDLLLRAILSELDAVILQMEKGEIKSLLHEWQARDFFLNKEMSWLTASQQVIAGRSLGIDEQGCYQIRDEEGTIHSVVSGDLTISSGA